MERATAASSGRDGAERRGELRLRARGVELGAAAGIETHLRELERRLLVRDVAARHVELLLLAAQLEVGARDFGRHDHLHVVQRGFLGAEIGTACFEPAAHAAEEVELPERIEARVVELRLRAIRQAAVPAVEVRVLV